MKTTAALVWELVLLLMEILIGVLFIWAIWTEDMDDVTVFGLLYILTRLDRKPSR